MNQATLSATEMQSYSQLDHVHRLLLLASQLGKMGGWVVQVEREEWRFTDEIYRFFDLDLASQEEKDRWNPQIRQYFGEMITDILSRAAHRQDMVPYDIAIQTARGGNRHLRCMGMPLLDGERIVRIEAMVQDITEQLAELQSVKSKDNIIDAMLRTSPDMLFLMDLDGTIREYRAQKNHDLYVPPEVFLNRKMQEVLPPEVGVRFAESLPQVVREGEASFGYELTFPNRTRHYLARSYLLAEQRQVLTIVRDDTEEFRRSALLLENEKRFRTMLDNAPFPAMMMREKDSAFLYFNKGIRELFGEEVTDDVLRALQKPYEKDGTLNRFRESIQQRGAVKNMEVRMRVPGRATLWALVSATRIEYNGEPVYIIALNDITRRKAAEMKLEKEHYTLNERIKEQKTIRAVLELTTDATRAVHEVLSQIPGVMVPGWQFPEITCVCISFEGKDHLSSGFRQTPWQLKAERITELGDTFQIVVGYTEKKPAEQEGPFFTEERVLLENIANHLTNFINLRRKESRVREQESLREIMFTNVGEALLILDSEGRILSANKAAYDGLGYAKEEFMRLRLLDFQADITPEDMRRYQAILAAGQSVALETRQRRKDGSIQNVYARLVPFTQSGQPLVCGVWRDITQEKRQAQSQKEKLQRLATQARFYAEVSNLSSSSLGQVPETADAVTRMLGVGRPLDFAAAYEYGPQGSLTLLSAYCSSAATLVPRRIVDPSACREPMRLVEENRYLAPNPDDPLLGALNEMLFGTRKLKTLALCNISSGEVSRGILCFGLVDSQPFARDCLTFFCQIADRFGITYLNRERLETLNALRLSENCLNLAQQVSKTGHSLLNLQTNALEGSQELYRMLNLDPGTKLDTPTLLRFVHPADRALFQDAWSKALDGGAPFVVYRMNIGQTLLWVEQATELQRNPDGTVANLLATYRDVTESVHANQELDNYRHHLEEMIQARTAELEAAKQSAEAASVAKSAFLSNMSHEIRTPMNAVIGYAQLLRHDPLTPRQADQLEKLTAAGNDLLLLINNILDISKIEANKLSLDIHNFEPALVVQSACDAVENQLREKQLALHVDLQSLPPVLKGDSVRLGQILRNFISNAVKFTAVGDIRVTGAVQTQDKRKVWLRFAVEDSGIGISADQQARLFRDFEQMDASITRQYGGTGLGLSINCKLAKLMGGSVGVESELGKGSVFWVELPFDIGAERPAQTDFPPQAENLRVLILDESEAESEALRRLLLPLTHRADSVCAPAQALEKLAAAEAMGEPYCLLLISDPLSDTTGVDFALSLRSRNLASPPRVILATAQEGLPQASLWENAGIIHALPKPVSAASVSAVIGEILRSGAIRPMPCRPKSQKLALEQRRHAKILLVEDNPINLEVAFQMLATAGMEASVAENGQKAVEMAAAQDYDLIFMDVQMPVMDGLQAARAIRALPRGADVPIVALTANAFESDKRQCLAAGMNDYLAKPILLEALYASLLKWLPDHADPAKAGETLPPSSEEHPAPVTQNADAAQTLARLEAVPGLDLRLGLRSALDDVPRLERLLRLLMDTHAHSARTIRQAAIAGDLATAGQAAHALKGACGALGFTGLQTLAANVEMAARKPESSPPLEALTQALSQAFDSTLEALALALPVDESPPAALSQEPFAQGVIPCLKELDMLLSQNDASAGRALAAHRPEIDAALGPDAASFGESIEDFDFQQALLILRKHWKPFPEAPAAAQAESQKASVSPSGNS